MTAQRKDDGNLAASPLPAAGQENAASLATMGRVLDAIYGSLSKPAPKEGSHADE